VAANGNFSPAERRTGRGQRITVVTPSLNQGRFLPSCIRSVLDQAYPDLEYIVVDGGSTDNSVDTIKAHEASIAWWTSEPDGGPYEALNKGFAHATGGILAWLNADDVYLPWTFAVVADVFETFPEVEWITTVRPLAWTDLGLPGYCDFRDGFSAEDTLNTMFGLQQESTFWRRSLWERSGGRLDPTFTLAADLELWARMFQYAPLYGVAVPLAGFRVHRSQRSARFRGEYLAQARSIRDRYMPLRPWPVRLARRVHAALPRIGRRALLRVGMPYRFEAPRGEIILYHDGAWRLERDARQRAHSQNAVLGWS
jgi:glycosyltransferase involved in cell wall biosynthesis